MQLSLVGIVCKGHNLAISVNHSKQILISSWHLESRFIVSQLPISPTEKIGIRYVCWAFSTTSITELLELYERGFRDHSHLIVNDNARNLLGRKLVHTHSAQLQYSFDLTEVHLGTQ